LPGLTDFESGFNLITQARNESDIAFAKRKLSALRPPLIQGDSGHALNHWHITVANQMTVDKLDHVLAETAYFYDEKNKRLIIRHTPIDETIEENKIASYALIYQVTQIIVCALEIQENDFRVQHVIPRIQGGRLSAISENSRHIILNIITENYTSSKKSIITENTCFDPRINFSDFFWGTTPNYQSICTQSLTNNVDCGRHVAVMATVAAKILAEDPTLTANTLTKKHFLDFEQVSAARSCRTADELQKLLIEIETASPKETSLEKLNEGWALTTTLARFSIFSNPTSQNEPRMESAQAITSRAS
jgi:hypothetical protein